MTRTVSLALALLVLAVAAAPAQAGWKVDRATMIANVVWQPAHCALGYQVHVQPVPPEVQAVVGHDGVAFGWVAAAGQRTCDLYLPTASARWSFDRVCHAVLHEGGHGVGLEHSESKRSVMYAIMPPFRAQPAGSIKWGADRRCRDRGRPFLERHAPLTL